MTEPQIAALVNAFGPTLGATLVGIVTVMRFVWPYFRDVYFPAQIKARQDSAQAQQDLAELVRALLGETREMRSDLKRIDQRTEETCQQTGTLLVLAQRGERRRSTPRAAGRGA